MNDEATLKDYTAQCEEEYALFFGAMLRGRWSQQAQLFKDGLVWRHQGSGRVVREDDAYSYWLMTENLPVARISTTQSLSRL